MLDLRILSILACVLAIGFPTFAQPFDKLIPLQGNLNQSAEVSLFSDENGGVLFVKDGNSGLVLKLGQNMEVEEQFEVRDLPDETSHQHLGFTYKDGYLSLAYLNKETQAYEVVSIHSEEEGTQLATIEMSRFYGGSVFWGTFSYEGTLHVVRLPKGKQSIRICSFEGGKEFAAEEYQVENQDFIQRMRANLTRIDDENPPLMERTYLPGKLYHNQDQLYLTLDEPGETHVVHINLGTGQKEEFSLFMPIFQDSLCKSNSLIIEDRILQLVMGKDSLSLTINDLSSKKVLHTYQYSNKDEWDISLWNAEKVLANGESQAFSSHEEFFRQIYDMPYLAIGAQIQTESKIEFQLGGVNPKVKKGVTGIIIDQSFDLAYIPSFIEIDNLNFPQSLPKLLVSNRFSTSWLESQPNYGKFKWKGKPYFGYFDKEKGGFYLSR